MAGPLDRASQHALTLGAIARDTAGHDLAFFRQKLPEPLNVLVIKDGGAVGAETADLFLEKTPAAGSTPAVITFLVTKLGTAAARAAAGRTFT